MISAHQLFQNELPLIIFIVINYYVKCSLYHVKITGTRFFGYWSFVLEDKTESKIGNLLFISMYCKKNNSN